VAQPCQVLAVGGHRSVGHQVPLRL
jgi:hypothetical protein